MQSGRGRGEAEISGVFQDLFFLVTSCFLRGIGFNPSKSMWMIRELVKERILKNGRRSAPMYVENCLEK